MNKKIQILFLCLLSASSFAFSQSKDPYHQIKALNNYVHFTNESIHGMMIVHRLVENYNQELNKYLDLQSNQLNFYGNEDLPKNVFVDEEKLFYRTSPYTWYQTSLDESKHLAPANANRLNAAMNQMKSIIDKVNSIRFELESFLEKEDLTNPQNQTEVFGKLEYCVDLYEDFYRSKEILRQVITEIYSSAFPEKNALPEEILLVEIYHRMLTPMKGLRYKKIDDISNFAFRLNTKIKKLARYDNPNPFFKRAKKAANEFMSDLQNFVDVNDFPEKYTLYEKHYYYHNVELASDFNNYGKGFVKYFNKFLTNTNPMSLLYIEEPHFYKVIYPNKKILKPEKEKVITELPKEVNDREVVVRQQSITVDSRRLELEIYDHKEQDGDIISINLNGKWILEKQTITNKPLKLLIDLNEKGENYLLMHAENLGKTPPNTAAIRYFYKGEKKSVILNSNMNESEMIKLEVR